MSLFRPSPPVNPSRFRRGWDGRLGDLSHRILFGHRFPGQRGGGEPAPYAGGGTANREKNRSCPLTPPPRLAMIRLAHVETLEHPDRRAATRGSLGPDQPCSSVALVPAILHQSFVMSPVKQDSQADLG